MRLAIISDIHEDYGSLQRILGRIDSKGYDKLICLGDVSGFSLPFFRYENTRNASACLELIREKCEVIIPGNHDLHTAGRIPRHSATFDFPPDWYEMDPGERLALGKDELWFHDNDLDPGYSQDEVDFLSTLQEYCVLDTPDYNILLSHYAYPNLSGFSKKFYTWEKEFRAHFDFMQNLGCSVGFTGHAHPRGFYRVTPDGFRHFSYRALEISKFPSILGIPPVTRHKHRRGFCIFDTASRKVQIIKL